MINMTPREQCPLCEGRGTLDPDPDAFLIEEVGDFSTWRARKADAFFSPFLPPKSQLLRDVHGDVPSSLVQARYIRSQTVRIIGVADELRKIGRGNDILVMLLVMVAENVAKLWFGYEGDRESKKHVRLFFIELTPRDVQAALVSTLQRLQVRDDPFANLGVSLGEDQPIVQVNGIHSAVDLLYSIRCEVVHAGRYRRFLRPGSKLGQTTYIALRECVVKGVIAVLEKCVQKSHAAAQAIKELRRQGNKCARCQATFDFGGMDDNFLYSLASKYSELERDGSNWILDCAKCGAKNILTATTLNDVMVSATARIVGWREPPTSGAPGV